MDRLHNDDLVLMFVMAGRQVEGVLLGYSFEASERRVFYLDTIAVRRRGLGLGTRLLCSLIEWSMMSGFESLLLDTEDADENGFRLADFYGRFGFTRVSEDEHGDITMELDLRSKGLPPRCRGDG